ncbi:type II secretion system protein, partial [Candidatus Falkowbacteria bacterium]|nr:type II secretion system protein [Candidatus Falkowbacteria bacterium]
MNDRDQEIKRSRDRRGFSLVEVILAIALFSLFATALIGILMSSYGSDFQAREREKATLYAQEGLEAVKSIRRQAWNLLLNGDYGLDNSSGHWQFSGNSDLLDDKYTRVIIIEDACRDANGDLVDCPGLAVDLHARKVISRVSYSAINGINNEIKLISYLTTWQSKDFAQTDWSGGSGQSQWSDPDRFSSTDANIDFGNSGEIKLASLGTAGCGQKKWTFNSASDYVFDPVKIEVVIVPDSDGVAQLLGSGGLCGGAPEACNSFGDQNLCEGQSGWLWDESGSSCQNAGSCLASSAGQCNRCGGAGCSRSGSDCSGTL